MSSCLLFILTITPFIAAGTIAFNKSQSLLSVLLVLLGAIAGAVLIPLSGIHWLKVFYPSFMESQAGGFVLIPIILPFFAYTGSVAGAWLVAILYGQGGNSFFLPVLQVVAVGLTVVLGGLIPSAIAAIPYPFIFLESSQFFIVPIYAICTGIASSWLASKLAYLLVLALSNNK